MCKSKMAINASEPDSGRRTPRTPRTPANQAPRTPRLSRPVSSASDPSASGSNTSGSYATTSSSYKLSSGTSSVSSRTSLSSLRDTLPENPHIYDVSEIRDATNGFLAKRLHSSATPSWRCTLRGKDVIVFQRKFRRKIDTPQLRERLSVICRSHHGSIVKLHGASVSGDHIYLVYEFINGANLADCLRNSKNPNFTVLSTWISRMQIATDLAHGLDYIHNKTGLNISLVHNHIKSSSIMVTEPSFNAKICNFGTAQLCGEVDENEHTQSPKKIGGGGEITEVESDEDSSKLKELTRSDSGRMQFEGARGYMSPEFQSSGVATQKSDVYAFGVVILELLSGEEPFKYKFDKSKGAKGEFTRTSVIDTARSAIDGGDDGGGIEGRLRKWVDRRLKDSFPVEVAEKITRVALRCVHMDPDKRPDMGDVAGRISQQYMKSRIWSDNLRVPTNISVSLAPR